MKSTFRKLLVPSSTLMLLSLLNACASNEPARPADFWGGVGFSYEADKISGGKKIDTPVATTHVGFEKDLGGGLGIGAEVAGASH